MATSPMPGGQMFLQVVPNGSLLIPTDRWNWITLDMLPQWRSYSPVQRATLVLYGLHERTPFYMWDQNAIPLVWDHEDKPVGGLQ